jgi:hypothetical protein
VKSELNGEYVITNPAMIDPKLRIVLAVAGSCGEMFAKRLPSTPRATTKEITTGIQATRSYLDQI